MNTTQYFRHENFLVIQNGERNDTFDLSKSYVNEFFDITGYLKDKEYSKHHLQRVANTLYKRFFDTYTTYFPVKEQYDYVECIIPNPKVTIDYLNDTSSKELQGRFAFLLNDRFVFAIYSKDFTFLTDVEGELTTNQYCEIIFKTASKETRQKLNEIILSLNNLAKYDAN